MRLSHKRLRKLIVEELEHVLLEQDLFGDEGAEEGEDVDEEEAEATEAEEGEENTPAEDEEAEEQEEETEPEVDQDLSLARSVDDELNAVFVDFEKDAIGVAEQEATNSQSMEEGSVLPPLSRVLFEQELQPKIDLETFAGDVARLVQNYQSLLDMKAIIIQKAKDYIVKNYDDVKADEFMEVLNFRYDLNLDAPASDEEFAPYAVGAGSGAAGGEA